MKVLVLYDYPPQPAGLATQGDLLYRGLTELGVEAYATHWESSHEKEWYYRWFQPDCVVGVGYWGYAPDIIFHPLEHGQQPVPWLVADGYIADYQETLNALPLILVTSTWVRDVHARDGIRRENMEVLPVGCNTDVFYPHEQTDPRVRAIREMLGVAPDELMLLTIGGDAASKGGREVMQALSRLSDQVPKWKYVCKVWPQQRTEVQNRLDEELAGQLGIDDRVIFATGRMSRSIMPYLMNACDVYVGPSRLEGFGMPHVEAGACGKPVIAIDAMAFRDTLVHGETALLAGVAIENWVTEAMVGEAPGHRVIFDPPRIADYRARVDDLTRDLAVLLQDAALRRRLGEAGRQRVVANYDYRLVARRFVEIVAPRLGITTRSQLAVHRQPQAQATPVVSPMPSAQAA